MDLYHAPDAIGDLVEFLSQILWRVALHLPFKNQPTNKQTATRNLRKERGGKSSILSTAFVVQIEAGNAVNVLTRTESIFMLTDAHVGTTCGTTFEGRLPVAQVIKARCSFLLES